MTHLLPPMREAWPAILSILLYGVGVLAPSGAVADDADLAKQLANPIATLISVPFQFNDDTGYGSENGEKAFVNVQPVNSYSLGEDWVAQSIPVQKNRPDFRRKCRLK